MQCQEARQRIPGYLDGELPEAQAAPLRRHLLDCQPCRAGAQGDKNLKRWFAATAASTAFAIPQGFASRVAHRAFAGDTGEPVLEIVPASAASSSIARIAPVDAEPTPLLRFVLQLTAAAALIVLALSVALRSLSVPSGSSLRAADGRSEITVDQALERLDALNRLEAEKAPAEPRSP